MGKIERRRGRRRALWRFAELEEAHGGLDREEGS